VTSDQIGSLLPLILIFIVFYLLVLRPARNRQRATLALQSQLSVGQEVMTAAGLYGTIVSVSDDSVVIEVAPGVRTRWARAAVAKIVSGETTLDSTHGSTAGADPAAGAVVLDKSDATDQTRSRKRGRSTGPAGSTDDSGSSTGSTQA